MGRPIVRSPSSTTPSSNPNNPGVSSSTSSSTPIPFSQHSSQPSSSSIQAAESGSHSNRQVGSARTPNTRHSRTSVSSSNDPSLPPSRPPGVPNQLLRQYTYRATVDVFRPLPRVSARATSANTGAGTRTTNNSSSTNTINRVPTANPPQRPLRPETLRSIEETTDSLRRVTATIENAYHNLARVRDSIQRTMENNPLPSTHGQPTFANHPSHPTHSNQSRPSPSGDRHNAPNSNSTARTRPAFLSSAFNSNMAPSHSAIVLADGTEVISPVNANRGSAAIPSDNGHDTIDGTDNGRRSSIWNTEGNTSTTTSGQTPSSGAIFETIRSSSGTAHRQASNLTDPDLGSGPGQYDPLRYSQSLSRFTTEAISRGVLPRPFSSATPLSPRQSPTPTLPALPTTLLATQLREMEDRSRPIRSATEALQSLTTFLEEFRSTMNRLHHLDQETDYERMQEIHREALNASLRSLPPRSPSPGEDHDDFLDSLNLFGTSRRAGGDPYSDDASTTLGRRVEARAAANASRVQTNEVDPVFERASNFADRLGSHLERLARHRDELLEASNRLRRAPESSTYRAFVPLRPTSSSQGRIWDSPPRSGAPSLPSLPIAPRSSGTGAISQTSRTRRRRQLEEELYQTPPLRPRTSHIDRTGRLSYNPTLPEDHPLAYIHQNPSVPIPGLTSQDFNRIDPVTGRRRRYTIISPVRDGADGVHTVTMSDSSSDEDPDPLLSLEWARIATGAGASSGTGAGAGTRQTSPRRMRVRRQRTLSQGASRPLLGNRERGSRRSVSRDRVYPRLPSFSSSDEDEDSWNRRSERAVQRLYSPRQIAEFRARAQELAARWSTNDSITDLLDEDPFPSFPANPTPLNFAPASSVNDPSTLESLWPSSSSLSDNTATNHIANSHAHTASNNATSNNTTPAQGQQAPRFQPNTVPMFSIGPDDSGVPRARVRLNGSGNASRRSGTTTSRPEGPRWFSTGTSTPTEIASDRSDRSTPSSRGGRTPQPQPPQERRMVGTSEPFVPSILPTVPSLATLRVKVKKEDTVQMEARRIKISPHLLSAGI